jgi:hypothetical protein
MKPSERVHVLIDFWVVAGRQKWMWTLWSVPRSRRPGENAERAPRAGALSYEIEEESYVTEPIDPIQSHGSDDAGAAGPSEDARKGDQSAPGEQA